ncbi:TIGR04282 family arsenosugar biosynthesis glycosyltransferase [Nonlabens xiamenensis]|uniref:TIGR04282 family arsenosugar biosynthesis glycosyltransferase n=1 Tax=Nonlabens xiamenensis TaxID=2341043 RepID=UPI000F614379|nr:DUF2064 domain-containing protein [Nonlabens xiamenensis]
MILHSDNRTDTAILIFANSGKVDAVHKGFGKQASVFKMLTELTIEMVQQTGLDYEWHSERQQRGRSFGERLEYSINSLFEKGYQQVIAIGNDTPELSVQLLRSATQNLRKDQMVIGPSLDGGFYLLGMSKSHFQRLQLPDNHELSKAGQSSLFESLSWCSSRLSKDLDQCLKQLDIETLLLEPLSDFDSVSDLKDLLSAGHLQPWLNKLITHLLFSRVTASGAVQMGLLSLSYGLAPTRGSPQSC